MSKSKNPIINEMRKIATSKHVCNDLPALLALTASLDFWHLHHHTSDMYKNFIQLICKPANFNLSFEELSPICHYSEKTIRAHCKKYTDYFTAERIRFRSMPLPLLIARFNEYYLDSFLRFNVPALRTLSPEDIKNFILSAQAGQEEKKLSMQIYTYFAEEAHKRAM